MEFIAWDESLELGVDRIDDQHKMLFSMVNELYSSAMKGKSWEKTDDIITGLMNYIKFHFSDEETLMKESGYPDLSEHKKLHNRFVIEVGAYVKKLRGGNLIMTTGLNRFLKNWLLNHIMIADQQIGKHLRSLE